MTRNYSPRTVRAVTRARNPAITRLGFTMFHFEGEWPVVVLRPRNAMSALCSL